MRPMDRIIEAKVQDAAGRYRSALLIASGDGVVHLLVRGPFHGRIGDTIRFSLTECSEPILARSAMVKATLCGLHTEASECMIELRLAGSPSQAGVAA
jgi:hypothetical protein